MREYRGFFMPFHCTFFETLSTFADRKCNKCNTIKRGNRLALNTDDKKRTFVANFKKAGGIVCVACERTGIDRTTYYRWCKDDPEFAQAVKEVEAAQIDFVESKLMENINAGDTKAMIFYLKTKGKARGWTERELPLIEINSERKIIHITQNLPIAESEEDIDEERHLFPSE